jgi:transposase
MMTTKVSSRGSARRLTPPAVPVSLSSVKRYVEKAHRGESLAPKKRPGSAPKLGDKAMKILEDDLKEHPFATLQERCDYIEVMTGLSVSRSTMCRAIARIGPTRKKGDGSPPSVTSSRGRPGK